MIVSSQNALLVILGSALAGCGGGGGGAAGSGGSQPAPQQPPGLFDATATEEAGLSGHSLTTNNNMLASFTGALSRQDHSLTLDGATGPINTARTSATLANGDQVTIKDSGAAHVARFTQEAQSGQTRFGVIGIPTNANDLPSGEMTYVGSAEIQAVDLIAVYELTGSAEIVANFGNNSVGITISDLAGSRTTGADTSVVQNGGGITISGADISGLSYSGGSASLTGGAFGSTLSGSELVTTSGGFYGPGATETGAALSIDDTHSGNVLINGTVIGQ